MKKLKKPEFSYIKAKVLDPNYFPDDLRKELRALLPNRISDADAARFLVSCAEEVQMVEMSARENAIGKMVEELTRIEKQANALRRSLMAMSAQTGSAFTAHFKFLCVAPALADPISPLSQHLVASEGGVLSGAWDILTDLEAGASYAASMCKPRKRPTVEEVNATALVHGLAQRYFNCFGELPPRNKETWFPRFVEHIGKHYGLKCGLKITRGELRRMGGLPEFRKEK